MANENPETDLRKSLEAAAFALNLFDRIPDVVFFVKDTSARYVAVNRTLVERCGFRHTHELLGRTTTEVFPKPLGQRYLEQDLQVCTTGKARLTDKTPLHSDDGRVIGVAGISRDLHMPAADADLSELSETLDIISSDFGSALRVDDLAARSGMSVYRFSRRIHEIFHLTPTQLITRVRIDAASELLRCTDLRVAEIAQRCGYFDQSAFTRQFRGVCGLTPSQYREM